MTRHHRFLQTTALASMFGLGLIFIPSDASAQTAHGGSRKGDTVQAGQEKVELSADQLTYDAETGEVRALGQVLLVRDGYELRAGEIRYNEKTGEALAIGAVELITPTGQKIFAPKLELSNLLKTAFVEDFRLFLTDGSQVAASSGAYDDESGSTTLRRAVYSPCDVCEGDATSEPVWQIKAVKVTHDRKKRRLYYKDAFLEFFGVPLLWTPYFSHPDPTVDKASGFLPVQIKRRNELGLIVAAPYHYVIDDSQDLTVTPTITTREGPVLAAEYRHNIGSGAYTVDGSITYANTFDFITNEAGDVTFEQTGSEEFRGHIRTKGLFNHGDNWRSNFDLSYASDDTYLRRYDFSNLDTLTSEYKLEGFFDKSYFSARTLAFQGLRQEDVSGLTAFALPLIDGEYVSNFKPLGGTVRLRGNALYLTRFEGLDTARLSTSASWQRRFITPKGFVVDTEAFLRSDYYNISDRDRPDDPAFAGTTENDARVLAQTTLKISWPLVRQTKAGSHTLEPVLAVTLSPDSGRLSGLVNEDSRAFELNELNLFSADRSPGFDLWEEGSRVTYGVNWRFDGKNISTDILFGQSLRLSGPLTRQDDFIDQSTADTIFSRQNADLASIGQFTPGTGLEGNFSDFVGHTRVSFKNWIEVEHRYRLDDTEFDFRRNEIFLKLGDQNKWGLFANYLFLDRDLGAGDENIFINREDREEIRFGGFYKIDENWRIAGHSIQNLTNGSDPIEYGGEITYSDECIEFGIKVRDSFTFDRDFNPGTSILFEIKLRNLG